MNDENRELDLALAECEQENRLLRARIDRLEKEAQREWSSLTPEEVNVIFIESVQANHNDLELIEAIEAKLKEKNHGT